MTILRHSEGILSLLPAGFNLPGTDSLSEKKKKSTAPPFPPLFPCPFPIAFNNQENTPN